MTNDPARVVYTGHYPIRTHEIDQSKRLSVPALIQLMQEASMQNVIQLRASVWDLTDQKVSWVLLRKELRIQRLPMLGETITVTTYPAGFDRVFAYRDYLAYDEQGQLIASAGSSWTLMHTVERSMVRIPAYMYEYKVPDAIERLPIPHSKIERLLQVDYRSTYRVGWYNLDWNGHVNNVFLVRCMLEAMPDARLQQGQLQAFTLHFKAESLWKDELDVTYQAVGQDRGLHEIRRRSDDKVIALGTSIWH